MVSRPLRPATWLIGILTPRGGLRARLMAAFIGLSALVVIAAAIAVLALWMNSQSHDRISKQSIPTATTALDLTRVAQRIVDTVPDLVAADTAAEQSDLTATLGARVDELKALLDQMRSYEVDPRAAASIDRSASLFAANIDAINRIVSARIAIDADIARQVAAGLGAVADIQDVISERTLTQGTGLDRVLDADPIVAAERLRLIQAEAESREVGHILRALGTSDTLQAAARVSASLDAMRAVDEDVTPDRRRAYNAAIAVLETVFGGGNNLAIQSAFREQLATAAAQAIGENVDLGRRFAAAVDRMIGVAKSDVAEANRRAAEVQKTAFSLLMTVVIATILSSFLIVRYYVHRNILARLTALTESMMAIAGGNLSAKIPEPTRDELGSMASALIVFRDTAVEVRDSSQREIQQTRSRLDHAIESIQEGFALFDADGALVLSNAQFGMLLEGAADFPGNGATHDSIIRALCDDGAVIDADGSWAQAARAYHADPTGTQIWELAGDRWVGATERRTDDGGRVMVVTDLTALKRHEIELDELVAQLQKASAAKSSFIANVSHELRTPLTAVLGFAQIVQSRLENVLLPRVPLDDARAARAASQVRENVEIMIQEGQRLTKMINDILDLEKIEAGQMVWDLEPLDIGSIVRQSAAATRSLYTSKGLEFHVDIAPDLPQVEGDRDRLVQVVINLISNAVKFTHRGHIACVAKQGTGPFVSVSVSDTGVGISPQDQREVFDKFRRVGDTLTEKPAGTGLGLPICREIVEHLGGSITVESMPGYGSTFTFQLPVAVHGAMPINPERNAHES